MNMPQEQRQMTDQGAYKDPVQASSNPPSTDEFLTKELDQAWQHYRHLETTRTTYLNFFFTIVTASAGFLALQLKDIRGFEQAGSPTIFILSLAAFFFVLFGVIVALMANIVRIGYVLGAYEDILHGIHAQVYGPNSQAFALWNVRNRIPGSVSKGVFRVQRAAEYLTAGACVLLVAAEVRIALVLRHYLSLHSWPPFVPIAFSLIMLLVSGVLVLRLLNAKNAKAS